MVYLAAVQVSINTFQTYSFHGFKSEIDTKQDVNAFSKTGV